MGGFLAGVLDPVGKALIAKNSENLKLKNEVRELDLKTAYGAWSTANVRKGQLQSQVESGQPLSPEETAEYAQLTKDVPLLQANVKKMSSGKVQQAFEKVAGFIEKAPALQKQVQKMQQARSPGQAAGPTQLQGPQTPQPGAAPAQPNQTLTSEVPGSGVGGAPNQQQTVNVPQPLPTPATPPPPHDAAASAAWLGSDQHQTEVQRSSDIAFYTREGKKLGLKDRDLAEWVGSKGTKLPATGTPRANVYEQKLDAFEKMFIDSGEETDPEKARQRGSKMMLDEERRKGQEKARNVAGWAHEGGTGKIIAVVGDLNHPGHFINENTGQPVPDGTEKFNPSIVTTDMKMMTYGPFGNYYRALRGENYSDEDARRLAVKWCPSNTTSSSSTRSKTSRSRVSCPGVSTATRITRRRPRRRNHKQSRKLHHQLHHKHNHRRHSRRHSNRLLRRHKEAGRVRPTLRPPHPLPQKPRRHKRNRTPRRARPMGSLPRSRARRVR